MRHQVASRGLGECRVTDYPALSWLLSHILRVLLCFWNLLTESLACLWYLSKKISSQRWPQPLPHTSTLFPSAHLGRGITFFTAETFAPSQKLLGTVRWRKSDWQVVPPPENFTTPPSSSACPLPLWCMLPAPNSGQLEVAGRMARGQRNPEQSWVAAQASQVMPPLKVGSGHILSALCCVCWVLTCCPQTHKVLGPRWRKGWNSQLHQREGKGSIGRCQPHRCSAGISAHPPSPHPMASSTPCMELPHQKPQEKLRAGEASSLKAQLHTWLNLPCGHLGK